MEKLPSLDWKRFWSFVAIGLFLSGPGLHYWYVCMLGYVMMMMRIGEDY